MTTTDFESIHPRAGAGRFTDKVQSTPQVALPAPDFRSGDELPNFWPGSAVEIGGVSFWRVADISGGAQWLSSDGDVATIGDVDFRVLPEAISEPDTLVNRAVAQFGKGDIVFTADGTKELGSVQRLVRAPGSSEVRVYLTNGGTLVGGPADVYLTKRGPAYTYGRENNYWDNVDATSAAHTDAATLSEILDHETEDDFMIAVIDNPNAAARHIELASQHHSTFVRRAAVFSPAAADGTIARIRDEALASAAEAKATLKREGVSPMSEHFRQSAASSESLARAATEQLARRGAAAV